MSASWDEFYDPLLKKECWTIEEVRTMLFPEAFWDEDETFSSSRVFNGKIPLWSIGSELISRALAKNTIICLGDSSSGPEHRTLVTRESVVEWIEFYEIFEWLESRGWKKPQQLDALIKSLNKIPLDGTRTQMKKEIADLKKKNEELKAENKKFRRQAKETGKDILEENKIILSRCLENVNSKIDMFHEGGILKASKLADKVYASPANSKPKFNHERIYKHLTKAINKRSQNNKSI